MGYPPLVTPTSQIVGTQATLNVLTGERYKVITNETKNYFLGLYGRAPGQLDREIMARARSETKSRSRAGPPIGWNLNWMKRKRNCPHRRQSVEDQLSFTLFPAIAREFFEEREKGDLSWNP